MGLLSALFPSRTRSHAGKEDDFPLPFEPTSRIVIIGAGVAGVHMGHLV